MITAMIIFLFFSGNSIGKAQNNTTITVNAKIAQPILIVDKSQAIKINGKKDKEYYNFKVKNYNSNGEITSIKLEYYVEILAKKMENISLKLYKDNQLISLNNNKTQKMSLSKNEKQEDSYQLEISYEKAKNMSSEEIIQDVQIKIYGEQLL